MALCREVKDLIRLHQLHDADEVRGVCQIPVVQAYTQVLLVWVLVQMVYTVRVEQRGAALDSVHVVALLKKELGEVGTILSGDAGNQSFFRQIIDLHFGQHERTGALTLRAEAEQVSSPLQNDGRKSSRGGSDYT